MARTKPAPEGIVNTGVRIQTRGPLGPSTPEVTIHSGVEAGALSGTPSGYSTRMRATSILVTDDASLEGRIPAREIIVAEAGAQRATMLRAHFAAMALPIEERTISVAGSARMVDAALDDAFRVVLSCDSDDTPPTAIAAWRSSRPKGSDVTTMTRD